MFSAEDFLEKEYHRLDLWYFVSFIAGIAYYFTQLPQVSLLCIVITLIASCVFLIYFYNSLILRFSLYFIIFFIIGLGVSKYRMTEFNPIVLDKPIITEITGRIEQIKPSNKGFQIIIKIFEISHEKKLIGSKVRINISKNSFLNTYVGDEISLTVKLFNLSRSILPGAYDFGFYLYLNKINASGYALSDIKTLKTAHRSYIQILRQTAYERLIEKAGIIEGNFLAALLLGESKGINKELLQDMRLAGISHILCVSGLHLSLVVMISFGFIRFILNFSNYLAYNFNIKILASSACASISFLYLLLTGVQIAASRAFVMTLLFIISIILDRNVNILRTLGTACVIIIILRPEYIFYPAFQLSFLAVLSLVSGYEFYKNKKLNIGRAYGIFGQIKFYIISNIYSSFLASIVTAPIVISQFYLLSTYCVLNNLIAVPIMSFILMPLALAILFSMPLGLDTYFIKFAKFFINVIIKFVTYSNSLPASTWYFGHITKSHLCIFLLGFFWVCIWQTRIRLFGIILITASFILMLNTKKPDFIYDYQNKILGMKEVSGKLVIYANHITPFMKNYWSNRYGQKTSEILPFNLKTFGNKFSLSINDENLPCLNSDIQINISTKCPGNYLEIDKDFLETHKVIAIYCNKKKCRIEK